MLSAPDRRQAESAEVPGRPRRRHRRLLVALATVLVLVVGAAGGIAWYFSGVALAVDHSESYPVRVLATPGSAGSGGQATVRLPRNRETAEAGLLGLAWAGGYGRVGPVVAADPGSVTRAFTPVTGGVPAVGTRVRIDSFANTGDPRTSLGLDFSEVRIPGPLGALPSWFVPVDPAPGTPAASGAGRTWVVFLHGHDSHRQESLRYLTAWHALGLPVLVPDYRDDLGAPASPDGWHHLGDTEWQDADAAVRWAHDHGAQGVVLAGWSMGGAIALQTADRSALPGMIRGLLLDSPVVDWRDVFARQGADRGLPGPEITLAEWTLQWRAGISLDRLDWASRAKELRVPTLIFHSDSDDYVPDGPALRLATARPDLVTLVRIPGARHTLEWNVDPQRYEATERAWLGKLLPAA